MKPTEKITNISRTKIEQTSPNLLQQEQSEKKRPFPFNDTDNTNPNIPPRDKRRATEGTTSLRKSLFQQQLQRKMHDSRQNALPTDGTPSTDSTPTPFENALIYDSFYLNTLHNARTPSLQRGGDYPTWDDTSSEQVLSSFHEQYGQARSAIKSTSRLDGALGDPTREVADRDVRRENIQNVGIGQDVNDKGWEMFQGKLFRERKPQNKKQVEVIIVDTKEKYEKIRNIDLYQELTAKQREIVKARWATQPERQYDIQLIQWQYRDIPPNIQ